EREREDLGRTGALARDEMRDPAGDDGGLSRARAGHDQERSVAVLDGGALLGVELDLLEERKRGLSGHGGRRARPKSTAGRRGTRATRWGRRRRRAPCRSRGSPGSRAWPRRGAGSPRRAG